MLDHEGNIAEATSANIFFKDENNELHTPIPDSFLDGITRKTVIDLAKSKNIKVHERKISKGCVSMSDKVCLNQFDLRKTPPERIILKSLVEYFLIISNTKENLIASDLVALVELGISLNGCG